MKAATFFPFAFCLMALINSYDGVAGDSKQTCTNQIFTGKDTQTIWTPNSSLDVAEKKSFASALEKVINECKRHDYTNCDNVIYRDTDSDYGKIFSSATTVIRVEGKKCMIDGKLVKDVINSGNNFSSMYNGESVPKERGCNEALALCADAGFNDCKVINDRVDNPKPAPAKFREYVGIWYYCVVHGQTTTVAKENAEKSEFVNDQKRNSKYVSEPSSAEKFVPVNGMSK